MTHALFSHRKHWRHASAPLPSADDARRDGRARLGCLRHHPGDSDAYIDHPSFGMALIGRMLEAQGYRVGIISQPDWHSADAFRALGQPTLYFGVTAGNMDSMSTATPPSARPAPTTPTPQRRTEQAPTAR